MILKVPTTMEIHLDQLDPAQLDELSRWLKAQAPASADRPAGHGVELPAEWRQTEVRHDVHALWGEDDDVYEPFTVYEGKQANGSSARLAIGRCFRTRKSFAEQRLYFVVMAIGPAGGLEAICEFLAADDHEQTREVISIVKGKEGSARQFDDPAELPEVYRSWRTEPYNRRVDYLGAFTKQALVCREDDFATMLNHALAQIQLRNL